MTVADARVPCLFPSCWNSSRDLIRAGRALASAASIASAAATIAAAHCAGPQPAVAAVSAPGARSAPVPAPAGSAVGLAGPPGMVWSKVGGGSVGRSRMITVEFALALQARVAPPSAGLATSRPKEMRRRAAPPAAPARRRRWQAPSVLPRPSPPPFAHRECWRPPATGDQARALDACAGVLTSAARGTRSCRPAARRDAT